MHHGEADSYTPGQSGRTSMLWYMTRCPQAIYERIPEDATREEKRAIRVRNAQLHEEAPRSTYPGTSVTFTDITDPITIQLGDLADLETTFGEENRFVPGRHEYTTAPRIRSENTQD